MSVEITMVAALLSSIAGIVGITAGIKSWLDRQLRPLTKIKFEVKGESIEVAGLSDEQIKKIVSDIAALSDTMKNQKLGESKGPPRPDPESGLVSVEALLLIVPGVIALMFAGTFIYLIIANQANPGYSTPKELGAAMTTIIGYYFGVGASTAINKSKTVSLEELSQQLKQDA